MAPAWSRRRLLAAVPPTGLAAVAGCLGFGPAAESRPPRFGSLYLRNESPERQTLHVLVIRDGDVVYWRSHRLAGIPAADDSDNEVTISDAGWMAVTGRWEVGIRVAGQPDRERVTIDRRDDPCDEVSVVYDRTDPAGQRLDVHVTPCPSVD